MSEQDSKMKLSELRHYIDQIIKDHGDMDVSITFPGWVLGHDSDTQHHAWNFGLYILDLIVDQPDGTEVKQRVACIGHVGIEDGPVRHLTLVKNNS